MAHVQPRIGTFLGGVKSPSIEEEQLAYLAGQILGSQGFTLYHGGYNGLMEQAAHGAASVNAHVVAITLQGKEEWGSFNPYVTSQVYAPDMGNRLTLLIGQADLIIAMGGGVGTLHELTAALWYASNVRRVAIIILGQTAIRLFNFLLDEQWLYKSPTRPLDFVSVASTAEQLNDILHQHVLSSPVLGDRQKLPASLDHSSLEQQIRRIACVQGTYIRSGGRILSSYFDPFRLSTDPIVSRNVAITMALRIDKEVDVIVGVALGGVTLAANVAAILQRPLLILRPKPKEYGTFSQLEGVFQKGQQAVLVDDVVRNGDQMLAASRVLIEAGLIVREAICVLEKPQGGRAVLQEAGIPLFAIITD